MKYLIICIVLFIVSCNTRHSESNLVGVYVGLQENEYGWTADTLIVSKPNGREGMFQILKHAGLVKFSKGKKLPLQLLTEVWIAEYDATKETLFELKFGKILIWDSTNESLQLGNTHYKKL